MIFGSGEYIWSRWVCLESISRFGWEHPVIHGAWQDEANAAELIQKAGLPGFVVVVSIFGAYLPST